MSTNPITGAIEPDIGKALKSIGEIARKKAEGRASSIAQLSDGTVQPTPEQLDAIAASIQAAMITDLREQVRSTVNAYSARAELFGG